jgi:hypothetical protein
MSKKVAGSTMRRNIKKILSFLSDIGFQPVKFFLSIKGIPFYFRDFFILRKQLKADKDFKIKSLCPVLSEKFIESGVMSGHYFHQDLLVARMIYRHNPKKHVDIGSRIDGFVAHVASFREIEVFDIRPQRSAAKNIIFTQADMMSLPAHLAGYCDSISSLHAIEHFGLGKYGDKIDVHGHLKGLDTIYKILKKDGTFYFSVPIGKQQIVFNAHRIFALRYLLNIFKDTYKIESFSYVNDDGALCENVRLLSADIDNNFNCYYGCAIFEMTKL